jgi:membrane protein
MRDAARPTLIGALVGTGLWLLATLGFRVYVSQLGRYDQTYGFVGGIIILLLWLYLTALAILFGGEVAATLQQRRNDDWEVGQAPRKRSD